MLMQWVMGWKVEYESLEMWVLEEDGEDQLDCQCEKKEVLHNVKE